VTEESEHVRFSVSMSHGQSQEFLRRLAEDDEFRERLQTAPREALAEQHIDVSDSVLPGVVSLPSSEDVQQILNSIEGDDPLAATKAAFRVIVLAFPPP
jgi:hypothetical protein